MAEAGSSGMSFISLEKLDKRIREILKDADLDKTTAKTVRKQLEAETKADLLAYKQQISDIINQVINENDEANQSDESEYEDKKSKAHAVHDSDSETLDEELARRLQAQDQASARKTRSGMSGKSKAKTGKKRKKGDADIGDSKPKKPRRANGFTKSCQLSEELADFVGESELPRHEIVKKIWAYVKERDLYDPKNRQFCVCDEPLRKLFGAKRIKLFGMIKHLTKHIK